MRALSITQPWAWLIIHGGKTVENRGWRTHYRGRFLVHAASRATLDGQYAARQWVGQHVGWGTRVPGPNEMSVLCKGGIIGAVTLVDVLPPTDKPSHPWHMAGQYGFVLADPEPLPFFPCLGALNFWGSFDVRDGLVVPTGPLPKATRGVRL